METGNGYFIEMNAVNECGMRYFGRTAVVELE